jgi:signal peptidase I
MMPPAGTPMLLVILLVVAEGARRLLRRRLVVVTVDGSSMWPTYSPGDRLLIRRTRIDQVRRGDVVIATRPEPGLPAGWQRELIVKRAVAVAGDPVPSGVPVAEEIVPEGQVVLIGDNPAGGYDSRTTGYFATGALLGVVIRRIRTGHEDR